MLVIGFVDAVEGGWSGGVGDIDELVVVVLRVADEAVVGSGGG